MSNGPKRICVTEERNATVITILDSTVNQYDQMCQIHKETQSAIAAAMSSNIVLDMANVVTISSVVLLPLLSLRAMAEQRGGRLTCCNLSTPVAQVLTISQLIVEGRPHARRLAIAADLESALAAAPIEVPIAACVHMN